MITIKKPTINSKSTFARFSLSPIRWNLSNSISFSMRSGLSSPVSCVVMWHEPHGDSHRCRMHCSSTSSDRATASARHGSRRCPSLWQLLRPFAYTGADVVVALRLTDDVFHDLIGGGDIILSLIHI